MTKQRTNPAQFGVATSEFPFADSECEKAYCYCRRLGTRLSRASVTGKEWLFINMAAKAFPRGRYLEIGSHRHVSTCAFLEAMDNNLATLTTVDVVYRLPSFVGSTADVTSRWRKITGSSLDIVPHLKGPFDVILVDGLHSDIGVSSDTAAAMALRSRSGVIIAHDANSPPAMREIINGLGTNAIDYYPGDPDHCKGVAVYPKRWKPKLVTL